MKAGLGSPPLFASEALQAQFEATDKLFLRLWVQVVSNPAFVDTPTCNRKQVAETYTNEWLPYRKVWMSDSMFDRADGEALNALTGRANGWARSCFPDFAPSSQVRGTDVEEEHKAAAVVADVAPGGAPPRDGGVLGLGIKKSTLFLGGVALLGGALALKTIFR